MVKILVSGFFSTVGDIEVLGYVKKVLDNGGLDYECSALHEDVSRALDVKHISEVDPNEFSHVLLVCGPVWKTFFAQHELDRFSHCSFGGINLTIVDFDSIDDTPFDYLRHRDWKGSGRIDLSYFVNISKKPVVGLILAPAQDEYGARQRHEHAHRVIDELRNQGEFAFLEMDTRWPRGRNKNGFNSPEEFESILSLVDAVVTTRLHGLVLSHKSQIPVVAIDPIAGGDKVKAQALALGVEHFEADDGLTAGRLKTDLKKGLIHRQARRLEAGCRRNDKLSVEIMSELKAFASCECVRARTFFEYTPEVKRRKSVVAPARLMQRGLRRLGRFLEASAQRLD
jgi:hypothetical protein